MGEILNEDRVRAIAENFKKRTGQGNEFYLSLVLAVMALKDDERIEPVVNYIMYQALVGDYIPREKEGEMDLRDTLINSITKVSRSALGASIGTIILQILWDRDLAQGPDKLSFTYGYYEGEEMTQWKKAVDLGLQLGIFELERILMNS